MLWDMARPRTAVVRSVGAVARGDSIARESVNFMFSKAGD